MRLLRLLNRFALYLLIGLWIALLALVYFGR